jgi:hypothetical protein
MSSNDEELAGRIVRHLDRGLVDMDQRTLARLRSARAIALEHGDVHPAWRLAWAGWSHPGPGLRYFTPRYILPVAALVLAVSGMMYFQQMQYSEDPVDIDAKLLASDLPIDAYLDQGLDAWLKR